MKIDSELTEKSAKNTQRWWKLTATIIINVYSAIMDMAHDMSWHKFITKAYFNFESEYFGLDNLSWAAEVELWNLFEIEKELTFSTRPTKYKFTNHSWQWNIITKYIIIYRLCLSPYAMDGYVGHTISLACYPFAFHIAVTCTTFIFLALLAPFLQSSNRTNVWLVMNGCPVVSMYGRRMYVADAYTVSLQWEVYIFCTHAESVSCSTQQHS